MQGQHRQGPGLIDFSFCRFGTRNTWLGNEHPSDKKEQYNPRYDRCANQQGPFVYRDVSVCSWFNSLR